MSHAALSAQWSQLIVSKVKKGANFATVEHTRSKLVVAISFLTAFALAASQARAVEPSDFTLGPSTLTVGVESDSADDGGCMNPTNDGCDSYKFKVPITVDPNNDIGDDLARPSDDLEIGISSTQFCGGGTADFAVSIPHASLAIEKTKGEDTAR